MASAATQKPSCPVCHQADQVKTMQAAYNSGVERCAPPEMPTKQIYMMDRILPVGFLVGIAIFLVLVLIGSEVNIGWVWTLVLSVVALVCIVAALVVSYFAFQRIVQGDAESTLRLPAWDRAMERWRGLYYCSRDDVIFDPQANQSVSDAQLAKLRAFDELAAPTRSAAMARHWTLPGLCLVVICLLLVLLCVLVV